MVSKNNQESGFSLIEVSIALIVISIIMIPLIQMWNVYLESRRISDTKAVLNTVNSALVKYVAKNNIYPIPENPNAALGTAASGVSATIPGAGWPACAGNDAVVCQTAGVNSLDPGADAVLIGTVPYAALGIPYRSAMDGYGRKMTYAVTLSMTAAGYQEDWGAIEVLDSVATAVSQTSIYGPIAAGVSRSQFFVASHGEDGAGAFAFGGVQAVACRNDANSDDFENCNGDGTFRNNYDNFAGVNQIADAAGATYFDDLSKTNNRSSAGMWTLILDPANPDMYASNTGNVAIGACAPPCIPASNLQVNGNVTATGKLRTTRICSSDYASCRDVSAELNYIPGLAPPGFNSPEQYVGAGVNDSDYPPDGVDINPLYTWDPVTKGHKGAGIRCTNGKALIGIKYRAYTDAAGNSTYAPDEICQDSASFSNGEFWDNPNGSFTTAGQTDPKCNAGKFARGITFRAAGGFYLDCVVP